MTEPGTATVDGNSAPKPEQEATAYSWYVLGILVLVFIVLEFNRRVLAQALMLMRNKGLIEAVPLLKVLFTLFRVRDKLLRQLIVPQLCCSSPSAAPHLCLQLCGGRFALPALLQVQPPKDGQDVGGEGALGRVLLLHDAALLQCTTLPTCLGGHMPADSRGQHWQ